MTAATTIEHVNDSQRRRIMRLLRQGKTIQFASDATGWPAGTVERVALSEGMRINGSGHAVATGKYRVTTQRYHLADCNLGIAGRYAEDPPTGVEPCRFCMPDAPVESVSAPRPSERGPKPEPVTGTTPDPDVVLPPPMVTPPPAEDPAPRVTEPAEPVSVGPVTGTAPPPADDDPDRTTELDGTPVLDEDEAVVWTDEEITELEAEARATLDRAIEMTGHPAPSVVQAAVDLLEALVVSLAPDLDNALTDCELELENERAALLERLAELNAQLGINESASAGDAPPPQPEVGWTEQRTVRAWAREQGIEVPQRGTLAHEVIGQYLTAHPGERVWGYDS